MIEIIDLINIHSFEWRLKHRKTITTFAYMAKKSGYISWKSDKFNRKVRIRYLQLNLLNILAVKYQDISVWNDQNAFLHTSYWYFSPCTCIILPLQSYLEYVVLIKSLNEQCRESQISIFCL